MTTERERRFVGPRRGQRVFALAILGMAVGLLFLLPDQTTWAKNTKLFAQPRFWPAVALSGMAVFAALHVYRLPWKRVTRHDVQELRRWLSAVEFAAWFMGYVVLVPIAGYLPVTLVFVPALAWRMGYRRRSMILICFAFATIVVIFFKAVLAVRIPGALLYETLPAALRSFAILYL
ncbi:tripartite tricarboxylate transporter TctB family protein [Phaeobacter sp.]|uniref:tripartite tricarboxylate transporter TctB family protein n=1 Tax=Phaeobacter sp. TaxID=1902409 RepID=UPI0025EA1645|nr:tripartite tricarboxylate transporter TctB family protein [Phaeobacter sp.]